VKAPLRHLAGSYLVPYLLGEETVTKETGITEHIGIAIGSIEERLPLGVNGPVEKAGGQFFGIWPSQLARSMVERANVSPGDFGASDMTTNDSPPSEDLEFEVTSDTLQCGHIGDDR
jgi:hypothetical protein